MRKIIFILLCSFMFAHATKGPEYRSLRVHGMGGAFVAVADGKEALYYNPAGLNLINRMGNFEKNPDMGYMPKNSFELRLFSISGSPPISANMATEVLDICGAPTMGKIVQKFLLLDFNYIGKVNWCPAFTNIIPGDNENWPDSIQANQDLLHKFTRFDRLTLGGLSGQVAFLEFAMRNFGMAVWVNTTINVYPEFAIIIPTMGFEPIHTDLVAQTAFAFSPYDKWSVGIGFKIANRQSILGYEFWPKYELSDGSSNIDYESEVDTLSNRFERVGKGFSDIDEYKYALDFGVLYQITRQVRVGSSLRNVFFDDLAGESITPDLSFGVMTSPMILQSNSWFSRKVHFAVDYVDVLNDNLSDMPLSHLNFGAEIEQTVIPSPFQDMSFLPRLAFGTLGGIAGFAIGYYVGSNTIGNTIDKFDLALGVSGAVIGGLLGAVVGGSLGSTYGFGNDMLKISLGGGFEGGYPSWTVGFTLAEALNLRFASYAEERGTRTGQKEHRYWVGEISAGF